MRVGAMTAILQELRLLEAEHARGRITEAELARRKTALVDAIPEGIEITRPEPVRAAPPRKGTWDMLILLLLAAGICGTGALLIVGDAVTAMTVGITVLAALTIRLFRTMED